LIKTKPGSPVLVDKANDIGQEVTEFMVGFCKPLGINQQTGWTNPIPEDHQPLRRAVDLVRDFEKPFTDFMDKHKLKPELRPFAAGLAARICVLPADWLAVSLLLSQAEQCSFRRLGPSLPNDSRARLQAVFPLE